MLNRNVKILQEKTKNNKKIRNKKAPKKPTEI